MNNKLYNDHTKKKKTTITRNKQNVFTSGERCLGRIEAKILKRCPADLAYKEITL